MATHTLSSFTVPNINGTGTLVYDDAAATLVFTPTDATQAAVMFSGLHAEPPNVDLAPFSAAVDAGTLAAQSIVNSAGGVEVSFVAAGNDLAHAVPLLVQTQSPNNNPPNNNSLTDAQLAASNAFSTALAAARADGGGGSQAITQMLSIALTTVLEDGGGAFGLVKMTVDNLVKFAASQNMDLSQVSPVMAEKFGQIHADLEVIKTTTDNMIAIVGSISS